MRHGARRWAMRPCLVAVTLAATAANAAATDGTMKRDVAYGPLPEQMLTACLPAATKREPHAGVVLIHGGGWVSGSRTDLLALCKALAHDGLVAATLDYRLVKKNLPATLWPAQLADVQLAVRWLRANAGSLGLDPTRLCAYGESAGGHLAVFLAAKTTIEPSDMASRQPAQPVSVVCAVDNFGPVDLADPGALKDVTELLLGKPLQPATMATFREASPLFLIGPGTAPIYVEQGLSDKVVAPSQSLKLFDALAANGVPARLITYSGGHGWKGVSASEQKFMADEERRFLRQFLASTPRKR